MTKISRNGGDRKKRSAAIVEPLEPRVLFSADILPVSTDDVTVPNSAAADQNWPNYLGETPTPVTPSANTQSFDLALPLEVIFVDAAVNDAELLIDGLRSDNTNQTQWLIVDINDSEDGVKQITHALSQLTQIDAVHILSHSDGEAIQLGSDRLDLSNAQDYTSDIASWGNALDAEADLLIYGCNLASSEDGRQLMQFIGTTSKSDVAASDDTTGHEDVGGDWDLEYTQGNVTTQVAFNDEAQNNWNNSLAVNEPPNVLMPVKQYIDLNTTLVLSGGNAIQISDADAGSNAVIVSLNVSNGTITLASTTGLSFSTGDGTSDSSIVATGSLADINTALDGLTFNPTASFNGTATIDLTTDDQGNSGTGGAKSANDSLLIEVGDLRLQQGSNGYTGTEETYLYSGAATTSYGNSAFVEVHDNTRQGLIRFNNIFGAGTGQIPLGSTITDASFSIYVTNRDALDPVNVHQMYVSWSESSTWDSMSGGITPNGSEASTASLYEIPDTTGWQTTSDLSTVVQYWSNGTNNEGFALLGNGTDGWRFHTSEYTTNPSLRPYMDIVYDAPTPAVIDLDDNNDTGATGGSHKATFTENAGPVAIADSDARIVDPDSTQLTSMTVTITNLMDSALESLAVNTGGTSLNANYNSSSGILTVSGTGSHGTYEQVLRTVTYNNTSENPDTTPRIIEVQATDGSQNSNVALSTININTTNDDPTNAGTLPGSLPGTEDAPANFDLTAINLSDVDASGDLTVTLTSSTGGQFTANTSGGVTITGSSTTTLALQGTQADLNTYLNNPSNITYQHATSDLNGTGVDSVNISVTDNGNTGSGGGGDIDLGDISININAVNDNPTNAGTLPTDIPVDEDITGNIDLSLIDLSDVDSASGNLELTLTTSAGGLLTATTGGGVSISGSNTSQITLTGNQSNLNNYLNVATNIQYTSASNASGDNADTIQVDVNDNGNSGSGGGAVVSLGVVNVDITAINDDPANAGSLPASITVTEDVAGDVDLALINLLDIDAASSDIDFILSTATGGTLNATPGTGITISGNASGLLTLTGSLANLNNYLDTASNIQYLSTSNANGSGADDITVTVNDKGNTGTGGGTNISFGTVSVDIEAANDDPTNIGSIPTDITVTEDSASDIDLSLLDISDIDSATGALVLSLTTSGGGTLTASNASGVSVSGSGTNLLTLTGTQADLNGYLNVAANIQFTSASNANGNDADTIKVEINDNGNSGTGGGNTIDLGTVNIDIDAVNDNPQNVGGLPTDITVTEDVASDVDLNLISLSDIDSASGDLTLTLSTSAGGLLTASSGAGVTATGSGSNLLTLSGTQADLNAYLDVAANIQYTSVANANGNNADTIQVDVNDNGNTGTGGGTTVNLGAVNINIDAVNDDPTNNGSLPSDIVVTEDVASEIDLSLIDLSDVDSASGNISLTLTTATGGTLTATGGAGISVTGSGSNQLTLTGTQADLNALLNVAANIQYTSNSNVNGNDADTIQVEVTDNGNTGTGGGGSITLGTVNIDIDAVNDSPTNTGSLPTDLTVTEDVASNIDLNLIDLSDIDSAAGLLTLTLSTTTGGTLASLNAGGVTATGSGSNLLTLSGTLADLNAFLDVAANVQYTSVSNANGNATDTLQIEINDNGNTGTGGGTTVNLGAVNINIDAVNDDPTNNGSLPSDIVVTEDVASEVDLSLIDLSDVDSASGNISLTLTTAAGGTLAATSGTGVSVVGSGSSQLTLTGTQSDLNAFLNVAANTQFTSTTNANGNDADTIQVDVTDNGNTGAGGGGLINLGTINIDIDAVNDNPTNAGSLPTDIVVTEDVSSNLDLNLIDISDVDSASGDLTLTLSTVASGTLTAASGGGVTVSGSGSNQLTLTGMQADLNAFLNVASSIQYTGTLNTNGNDADEIEIEISDNGNTGPGGGNTINLGTVNIDIDAVNDDPVNNGNLPSDIIATEDLASDIDLSLIDLSDVDSAAGNISVILTTTSGGTLAAASGTGVGVTGSASNQLTLTGTQNDLNAFLNSATNIQFTSALHANGNDADAIQVAVNDNGNTGAGGGTSINIGTVNIDIDAVNDDPTNVGSLPTDITVTEDTASDIDLSLIDLLDIDSATGDLVLSLTTSTGGTLTAASGGNVTVTGSGSTLLELSGTQADLNTFLNVAANIQFTGANNTTGNDADTIQVAVNDNGNTGTGGGNPIDLGTVNIDFNAINDDPFNNGSLPADINVTEDTASDVDLSLIDLSDVDSASGNLSFTLTTSAGGTLSATNMSGISVTGSGTGSMTLTGTQASLNSFLNVASNIQYTSAANSNGNDADSIQVEVNDNGNTGAGGGNTVNLGTVNIDIDAVNDNPENTGSIPLDIVVTEDIASDIDLSDIDLFDVDSASGDLSLTLNTITGGTLSAVSGSGVNVTGSGSGQLTLTGTQASLNAYLNVTANLQYTGTTNVNGNNADAIAVEVIDNGNTGAGGNTAVGLGTVNIDIEAVNDNPTNTGSIPADIIVTEDVSSELDLSLIDIDDIDSATGDLTLSLNTTAGGTLAATSSGGVTVIGSGTNLITLSGTQADLNSYLDVPANIMFTSAANANGNDADTVDIEVSDNGNTGTGGGTQINLGTVNIDIDAVNDDPNNAGSLPTDAVVVEDIASDIDLSSIDIFDEDAGSGDLSLTLSTNTGGILTASAGTGLTITGSGSNQITLTGSQLDLNSYLNQISNIQYQSAQNATGNDADTIQVNVSDNGSTGNGGGANITFGTVNIDIDEVNDDPSNTGSLPATITVLEDTASNIDLNAIELSDIDSGSGNLTLSIASSSGGTVLASSSGGVVISGSGSNAITLTGTKTDLNTFLDVPNNIQYTGSLNSNGNSADSLSITLTDNGNTGSGGGGLISLGAVIIDITPINDRPVLNTNGAPELTYIIQNATDPAGTLVSAIIASAGGDQITDVDAAPLEGIAVTSVDNSNGDWQYSIDGGASWVSFGSVTDTSAIVLTDSSSDSIRFLPDFGYSGYATFDYKAWDRTDASASGATVNTNTTTAFSLDTESASIQIEAAQVLLWLSTREDVGPAYSQPSIGVAGLDSWSEGSLLGFSDPGFSLGENTTAGTFNLEVDFDQFASDSNVDVLGLHYVTRAMTLAGPHIESGSIDLLPGDVLFTTLHGETLSTGTAGAPSGWSNNLSMSAGDISLYRPQNPNDYRTGYMRLLIQDQITSSNLGAFTMLESATTIGDKVIDAGDFLYTQLASSEKDNIYWYQTSTGDGTNVLVDGADIGLTSGAGIDAIEVIETSLNTTGASLTTGAVLISTDVAATVAGQQAQPQDILALNFTSTSLVSGNATATAEILFDGDSNADFDHANENIDAISLIVKGSGSNQAPVLSNTGAEVSFTEDSNFINIDGTISVEDADSLDFDNGSIRVEFTLGNTTSDRLAIHNQGTGAGQIGVSGVNVTYSGTVIGTVTGGHNTPLVVSLNSSANETSAQAVMRNIIYWNNSDNPTSSKRTIEFQITDGDGGTSNIISQKTIIVPVADSPVAVDDNHSLRFDGSDYVLVADDPALTMTNTVTQEAWIKPQGPIDKAQIITNKEGEYEVAVFAGGSIQWAFANTDPGWRWHNTGYIVEPDVWTHIAVVYDNGTVSSYANGKLIDVYYGAGAIGDTHPAENTFRIGGREALPQHFEGQIDEVRIWNTARTGAEISSNLDVALSGNESGLAGYWPLNEGAGNTTVDLTANANHGTLTDDAATGAPDWIGYRTDQDTQLVVPTLDGLVSNDIDGDDDSLNITSVNGISGAVGAQFTLPSGANLTLDAAGGFTYDPNGAYDSLATGASATDTFTYSVSDGNTSDDAIATIHITGINDAPLATNLNAPETYTEDQPLSLIDIVVSDVDNTDATVTLSLSDLAAGTLSTGTSGAVTSTFINGVWSASGSITDINVLLAGITYTPTQHYNTNFTIATSVSDGEAPAVTGLKSLTATAVNDAPVVTAPATAYSASEQTNLTIHGTGFSIEDVDESGSGATLEIAVTEGKITVNSGDSSTSVSSGNGSNSVTINGTISQINNLLTGASTGTITYINDLDTPAATTVISVTVNDTGNTGTDPGLTGDTSSEEHTNSQTINITAINDDPVNTGIVPVENSVTEDVASNFDLSQINLVDADATGDLTLTLASTTGGNLTASSGAGVIATGSGTGSLALTGTQTDLNNYLNNLSSVSYLHATPNLNGINADTVNVSVRDNGNTGSGGNTNIDLGDINVNINAVNDDPTNSGSVPTDITVTEDISSNIDLSLINLSDIDAGTDNLTLTLSTSAMGTLSANTAGGVTVTSNAPGQLLLTGDQTSLNNFIDQPSNIQFLSALNANGNDADTITIELTDNGNIGTGGGTVIGLGIVNIDINAINDNPTNAGTLSTDITVTEDIASNVDLSLVDLVDVDSATGDLTLTLSTVTGGQLTAASVTGVTVTGSGTNQVTLTGTQTNLNSYLDITSNVQYLSSLNANGNDTDSILLHITDNGNTGTGGAGLINLGSVNVDITAVNDDPVNAGTLPNDVSVTEDISSNVDLSQLVLDDVDSTSDNLTLTLATTAGGGLSAISTTGVSVTGTGSSVITLTGSQTELNSYLALPSNIQYLSVLNQNGNDADSLSVNVTDNGNTGNGGGNSINLGSVNIDIDEVNDDPTNLGNLPSDITVTEDVTGNIDLSLINLSDVDSATGDLTLSLATTTGGTLVASDSGGVVSNGSGSNLLTLTGNQADLNAFLSVTSNIQFTSALNANGNNADTIIAEVTDNGNTGTGGGGTVSLGVVNIDIDAVNDDPVNIGSIPSDIVVTEDVASNLDLSLISLSDVDSASDRLTLTLVTNSGTMLASTGGSVIITGSGTNTVTLSGNHSSLNSYLGTTSNIQYLSALHANGDNTDAVTIDVTDNGNTGSGGGNTINLGTVNIDIDAVNDNPVNLGSLPTDITVIEDVSSNIDMSLINLSDVDSAANSLTLTLTTTAGGTLLAANAGGVATAGSGTNQLTLSGNQSDLNTFLSLGSSIQFTSSVNANGNNADSILVEVTDNGNNGTGGGGTVNLGTVNIDIDAVNDDPVNNGTLPFDIIVNEDVPSDLDLGLISLSDVDSANDNLTITLATGGGTLLATTGGGVSATGSGTDTITLTGNLNSLNSYLALPSSIQYLSMPNTNGNNSDTVQIDVSDNGNTGSGGGNTVNLGTVNIDIDPINDDPENLGSLPIAITVTEDLASDIDLSTVNLSDVDAATGNLTMTLSSFAGGTLTTISTTGIVTTGDGTNLLTLTGTLTDLNTYLSLASNIQYTSVLNANGNNADVIAIEITDNGNTGAGGGGTINLGTVNIHIDAVNDDPINSGTLPLQVVVTEDVVSDVDLSLIDLLDIDSASDNLTLTLSTGGGTLTAGTSNNVNITGSGTNQIILTGSQTNLNTYLNLASNIQYLSTPNTNGLNADTLTINITDNGNTGNGGGATLDLGSVNIDIDAVNDAPVNTVPAIETVPEDTQTPIQGISITDLDIGSANITTRLQSNNGVLAVVLDGTTTISAGSNNSSDLTISGNIVDVNATLASLLYTGDQDINAVSADTLIITTTDNGNTGSGGEKLDVDTIQINITAINDAPVNTIPATQTIDEETQTAINAISIADVDAGNGLLNTRIQVSNGTLDITLSANTSIIAGANNSADLTLQGTLSDINTTLATLLYTGNTDITGSAADNLIVTTTDNGNTGANGAQQDSDNLQIDITAINDTPILSGIESTALNYTENDTPTAITSTLTLSDVDNSSLQSATVQITGNYQASEDSLGFASSGNIIGLWNSSNGSLTLSGNDTLANYQAALRSVTYQNISENPDEATRSVSFVVDDGQSESIAVSRDITIDRVNDEPSGTDNTITTLEDTAYTLATADFGFSDVFDSNQFDAVIITSLPSSGALMLAGTPVSAGQAVNVTDIINEQFIYAPPVNSNAAALDTFSFQVRDDGGQLNSGINQDTTPATMTVNVISVNDAPTGTDTTLSLLEDTAYTLQTSDFGYTDSNDNNELESVTIDSLPVQGLLTLNNVPVTAGQTINIADIMAEQLVFTPDAHSFGTSYSQIEFRVTDDGGIQSGGNNTSQLSNNLTIDISDVNDPPQGTDKTIPVTEDTSYIFTQGDFGFSDVNDNHSFSAVTISSVPDSGSLTLDSVPVQPGDIISILEINNGVLAYSPSLNAFGNDTNTLGFKVHDDGGTTNGGLSIDTDTHFINFDLQGVNDPPQLISEVTTFDEGSDNIVEPEMLYGSDVDDTLPEELTITLTTVPVNGVLNLSGVTLSAGDTVTLADIAEHRVRYVHDGSETSTDSFDVSLADGGEDGVQPVTGTFTMIITEVIDPAPVLTEDSIVMQFGDSFDSESGDSLESGYNDLLQNGLLNSNEFEITIVNEPMHGTLDLSDDGKFSYVHDGSPFLLDEFTYKVTNADGVSAFSTVKITVEPVLEPAFEATPVAKPEPVIPTPVQSEEEPETPVQNNLDAPIEFNLPEAAAPESEKETLSVYEVNELDLAPAKAIKFEHQELEVTKHQEFRVSTLDYDKQSLTTNSLDIMFEVEDARYLDFEQNSSFFNSLNQINKELEEAQELGGRNIRLLDETVMGVSVSVLAGGLAWALRGGALFASFMAATPLWSSLDPGKAFVATKTNKDKYDNSNESDNVEEMFEKKE